MEQEKYKRAIEIAHELHMLDKVVKALNDPDCITTLRFCWTWNEISTDKKWRICDGMDCISEILARHTVMVIHEIQKKDKSNY